MLVTFKSAASADVIMFGDAAKKLIAANAATAHDHGSRTANMMGSSSIWPRPTLSQSRHSHSTHAPGSPQSHSGSR